VPQSEHESYVVTLLGRHLVRGGHRGTTLVDLAASLSTSTPEEARPYHPLACGPYGTCVEPQAG
jgi:hypothetical protein